MLTFRDLVKAFNEIGLGSESQVLVHASSPALGGVAGGAETLAGSIMTTVHSIITPTFTTKAMIIPPFGPEENAIYYGASESEEAVGEHFHMDLPADEVLGEFAEVIRRHQKAQRSTHPLLSFAGVNAMEILATQTLEEPWAPIKELANADGDVLLFGVEHTMNVSIHYAEFLVGRKQFLRWAMWEDKVVEVPHWPGCSKGFQHISSKLAGVVRDASLTNSILQAIPLRDLINIATGWIREDPEALLCHESECQYCDIIRASPQVHSGS
jgi:aminoglycoside 3-N-acetyltransferase